MKTPGCLLSARCLRGIPFRIGFQFALMALYWDHVRSRQKRTRQEIALFLCCYILQLNGVHFPFSSGMYL